MAKIKRWILIVNLKTFKKNKRTWKQRKAIQNLIIKCEKKSRSWSSSRELNTHQQSKEVNIAQIWNWTW
jgi:hypothetical protein